MPICIEATAASVVVRRCRSALSFGATARRARESSDLSISR